MFVRAQNANDFMAMVCDVCWVTGQLLLRWHILARNGDVDAIPCRMACQVRAGLRRRDSVAALLSPVIALVNSRCDSPSKLGNNPMDISGTVQNGAVVLDGEVTPP